MTYSDTINTGASGQTLYAKPRDLVDNPWGDDAVENPTYTAAGDYKFEGLADGVEYVVFLQSGDDPASSDTAIGELREPVSQSSTGSVDSAAIAGEIIEQLGDDSPLQIVRMGPLWDAEKSKITVRQGDDYLGDRGLKFDLNLPGVDLSSATAKWKAKSTYNGEVNGDASILDPTGNAQLHLEWPRSYLMGTPECYEWDCEIIVDDEVMTVFYGDFEIEESKTALVPVST